MTRSTSLVQTAALVLLSGALSAACSSAASSAAPSSASTSSGGADAGSQSAGALDCPGIFTCAADCADSACEDACLAEGTDAARAAATGIVECFTANKCEDAACLQQSCSKELGACTAPAAGAPPVANVPKGSVPADLVGKWHYFYAPTVNTEDWTFAADGSAILHLSTTFGIYGCTTLSIEDSVGTAVFTDTTMTYHLTSGTVARSKCGSPASTEPSEPRTLNFEWSIEDGKLVLLSRDTEACQTTPPNPVCTRKFDRD